MVHFVFLLQSTQDGDGVLHGGLAHQHLLKPSLERSILFDVLAVLVERRCADAVQLATRQCGLEHVACIDCAFRLARAHHRVDLVDEDDRPSGVLSHFLEDGFEPLFELATILGARQQLGHVENQHALVFERLGHLTVDDALREAFDDRGLADARLADQHGIVLGAALQNLNGATDLVVPADDRVELALASPFGEVDGVLGQSFALPFRFGTRNALAAAHRLDRAFEVLPSTRRAA